MMRRLGQAALLIPVLFTIWGCSAPYADEDFEKAIAGIDHISESHGGCNTIDLAWRCDTTVVMSLDATAKDIEKAIKATGTLLRRDGRNTSKIEVNDGKDGPIHGAVLTFSAPPPGADHLAEAMQAAGTDEMIELAQIEADAKGASLTVRTTDDELGPLIGRGSSLLGTSRARSIRAVTEHTKFILEAKQDAWPATEIAILKSVDRRFTVEKARAEKDFLSIVGMTGDMDEALVHARGLAGFDLIDFVDISNDVSSDLSAADREDLPIVGAIATELRRHSGYRRMLAGHDRLTITADSVTDIAALDKILIAKFPRPYAAMDVTFEVVDVLESHRSAGQEFWHETAETLVDTGLFTRVRVGRDEPGGTERAIEVVGKDGVGAQEVARAVAKAWRPDQSARIEMNWDTPARQDSTWFTARDPLTLPKELQLPKEQGDLILKGWAEGRVR